jgi:dynein heavy chain
LGSLGRLVITPLTERCWNTITGALALRLGAAPAGPAGTGKTESTKDLAKGLAIFCVVFNCGPTVETKMIITLCCGLTNQGSWACLDEFNRIRLDVLSVIAEMMTEIKDKRLQHTNDNKFDETFQGMKVM